jgi:hypothetical protein
MSDKLESSPKSLWYFVFQTILSSVPAVLVIASLPALVGDLKLSGVFLGFLFCMSRLGGVLGNLFAPRFLQQFGFRLTCVGSEIFNFITVVSLFLLYEVQQSMWLGFVLLMKGISSGLLSNSRLHWIRQFEETAHSKTIVIWMNAGIQSAYGIAGLIFIFSGLRSPLVMLFLLDAISSLLGAYIFSKSPEPTRSEIPNSLWQNIRSIKSQSLVSVLNSTLGRIFLIDLLMAFAFGGTNILLVHAGEKIFSAIGGYGASLVFYAALYSISSYILQSGWISENIKRRLFIISPAFIAFSFLILSSGAGGLVVPLFCFAVALAFYPLFMGSVEVSYFQLLSKSQISAIYGMRTVIVTVIWAVTESFYSVFISSEYFIRTCFAVACAILVMASSLFSHSALDRAAKE